MYGRFNVKNNDMNNIKYDSLFSPSFSHDANTDSTFYPNFSHTADNFSVSFKVIPCSCEIDNSDVIIIYDGGTVDGY